MIFAVIVIFLCGIWLGYVIGWSRGYGEWNRTYRDSIMYGMGFSKDGKRIDPKDVFVDPPNHGG